MMQAVRDKVTDLIFRARVIGAVQARSAYRETAAVHESAGGYGVQRNGASGEAGRHPQAAQTSLRRRRSGGDGGEDRLCAKVRKSAATIRARAAAARNIRSAAAPRRREGGGVKINGP
jgi:hypothetical protein